MENTEGNPCKKMKMDSTNAEDKSSMRLLCQGAEAKLYTTQWLGRPAVVKQRFPKTYRVPALDAELSLERSKAEARGLARLRRCGVRAPWVYELDLAEKVIVMEHLHDAITVKALIYQYTAEGHSTQAHNQSTATLHPLMKGLAERIAQTLSTMHRNDIIHGDLTTSNLMVREPFEESPIYLIDMGLSSVDSKVEDKGTDLYVLERAVVATHPNTDTFVEAMWQCYGKSNGKQSEKVVKKLDEVRMRGRKKLCMG